MLIKVFGPGCAKCQETAKNINAALRQSGSAATVEKVMDLAEIARAGILSTPAVSIDGRLVVSGRVPSLAEIKGWLGS